MQLNSYVEEKINRIISKISSEDGFTIVEILAVMLIIGIIVGIAFVSYYSSAARAQEVACKRNQQHIEKAIESYALDTDVYPNNLSDLLPNYLRKSFNFECPKDNSTYQYDSDKGTVSCQYGPHNN